MKAYMTNGTGDFLTKLAEKHPQIDIHIMSSGAGSLAYYEGVEKKLFVAGRTYEVIVQKGDIKEEGFVAMNNIPVTEEGRPVFEDRFKNRKHEVDQFSGFQAFRLLRPLTGNTYVVFTQWESEVDYDNWVNSDTFKQSHAESPTKPSAYFADNPFLTTYYMKKDDE
ncbi:antibiotic biosynthesis monooxygenase [Ornithinibacillus sp. L9]|uniref:Antibiotic biosynthesis monooxygenase n=1 Tax=Ornithinibacillus caprae TaxID=2678566 RepID=A0A6N8FPK6_9BACI|nr:antibiotic biosynthesis monooxygenase [Ornithinibacillus caprae]MUK90097.1 antibiotic biosynthesis monooxygenase [Ornithinibacillus caprae]